MATFVKGYPATYYEPGVSDGFEDINADDAADWFEGLKEKAQDDVLNSYFEDRNCYDMFDDGQDVDVWAEIEKRKEQDRFYEFIADKYAEEIEESLLRNEREGFYGED